MHSQLQGETNHHFHGIRIDTCGNRSSIISSKQYQAYRVELSLKHALRQTKGGSVKVIGGPQRAIGTAMINIPFRDLEIIIDVHFMVIKDDIPTLLFMREMVTNGLDI